MLLVGILIEDFVLPCQTDADPNPDHSPEQLLLLACLNNALVILSRPYKHSEERTIQYKETVEWFRSDLFDSFSFLWICFWLKLNPIKIRQEIFEGDFTKVPRRRQKDQQIFKRKLYKG